MMTIKEFAEALPRISRLAHRHEELMKTVRDLEDDKHWEMTEYCQSPDYDNDEDALDMWSGCYEKEVEEYRQKAADVSCRIAAYDISDEMVSMIDAAPKTNLGHMRFESIVYRKLAEWCGEAPATADLLRHVIDSVGTVRNDIVDRYIKEFDMSDDDLTLPENDNVPELIEIAEEAARGSFVYSVMRDPMAGYSLAA